MHLHCCTISRSFSSPLKKIWDASQVCVSSLHMVHPNLLSIVQYWYMCCPSETGGMGLSHWFSNPWLLACFPFFFFFFFPPSVTCSLPPRNEIVSWSQMCRWELWAGGGGGIKLMLYKMAWLGSYLRLCSTNPQKSEQEPRRKFTHRWIQIWIS